jgi:hypothetical protein
VGQTFAFVEGRRNDGSARIPAVRRTAMQTARLDPPLLFAANGSDG